MISAGNPKRFFKSAGTVATDQGWSVVLDERPIKTPARSNLVLPTRALAECVAQEWDCQGEQLDLHSMTLTRLANVAIDRTPYTRLEMIEELARYAQTDLICHLEGNDAALRARQEALWTPWRNWAGKTLDIVLVPVEGIVACPQPDASLQAVRDQAGQLDAFSLTALNWATALFGSVILGFAVQSGQLAATDAHTLSHLDQDFQAERWGEDDEARAAKQSRAMDAEAVGRWFEALLA